MHIYLDFYLMSSFWYVCKLAPLYDASSRTVVPEGAVASIILNFPDSDASLRDETRYQVFHTVDVPKKYECAAVATSRIALAYVAGWSIFVF
jgi:hypothetical protein